MTLQHNDTEFDGFGLTIISTDQELTPELVSDVTKVRSSGVDAAIVERRVLGSNKKVLEVCDTEYGDHYEVNGIVGKKGTAALKEVCTEGAMVTILSDDCDMADDDFTVRDLTIADESIQDDNNDPRYFFSLILKE